MAKILVVDDNEVNRLLIVKLFSKYKHQLEEATNGVEALAKANAAAPDLVFTDLLMPQMDGYELIRQLRANPQTANIPIIVYTALYMARGATELTKAYGVNDVLTKPSKPEFIMKAVTEALGLPFQLADPREKASWRLGMFLEITQQLSQEHNPALLLGSFCERARKIIGAQHAFLGIPEKSQPGFQHLLSSGIEIEQARTQVLPSVQPLLERALAERLTLSFGDDELNAKSSAPNPAGIHSALAAPLFTPKRLYGWVCLVDKLGAARFGEEDEQLLGALASQVANTYEDLLLNTELQQKIEQLTRDYKTQLESIYREREAFSTFVAQDIRAPLRDITTYAISLLEQQAATLGGNGLQIVKHIYDSASQTEKLITDMLVFSQLGRKELEKTQLDLTALAQGVVNELQQHESARHLKIIIHPLPPAVADLFLVKQALSCLLANASKFTRARSYPLIEVGCQLTGAQPVYYVKDNGVGFDPRQAGKIFDIFYRLHRAEEYEGKGIGLAIARRAIERQGGHLWAESQPEVGATFYFTLP
jgi:signal transduction histidine kinase/DNA-binding NarL/FixJ family response regulator